METTAASGIEPNWSLLRRLMERAPSLGWRASGLWALDVLEDRLGAEWPAKFGNKPSGIPAEIAWAAGHTGAFTWLMELALRLHILGEATGMAAVRKGMVTDLREESLRHACLQLEVATLALGGGWDVALECHLPDATSPVDVSLKRGDQAFGVETRIVFQDADMRDDAEYSSSIHDSILALEVKHEVTIGGKLLRRFAEGELADWLGRVAQAAVRVSRDGSDERVDSSAGSVVVSPGKSGRAMPLTGPPIVGRGWPRTATLLQDKCEQISRSGAGWLRFDLLDGQWQFTPWATLPLPAKTETLAAQLRSSISGASGAVLSHGAGFAQGQFLAENYRSPAGAIGLRRLIAPCRVRETIIVPLTNDVDAQTQTWIDIYDDEPSWLEWALADAGLPSLAEILE